MNQPMRTKEQQGFTVVELLVCIVVIAILVGVATVGYGEWRKQTAISTLTSDLKSVASAMETEKNFSNGYPTTIPQSVDRKNKTTITLTTSGDRRSFCAQASTDSYSGLIYRYRSGAVNPDSEPVQGTC